MKNNNENMKEEHPRLERYMNILSCVLWVVMIVGVLHYGRRIFVAERFNIPSESMQPTLRPGDRVWVNKLLFGGRIYTSFNFEDHAPLKCFRMPGLRKIRPGDVICFNYPLGYDQWTEIEFKINYVYCKRVVGCPGDSIGIRDGLTWNNNYEGTIGVLENQMKIHATPDSILWRTAFMATMPFTRPMWTMKNFGPLYIPEKGTTIELDSIGRAIYGPVIEYETGSWPADDLTSHTFQNNYYFALGDNSLDSNDSRYWGFIPEDFIIGIVGGRKVRNNPYLNQGIISTKDNVYNVDSIEHSIPYGYLTTEDYNVDITYFSYSNCSKCLEQLELFVGNFLQMQEERNLMVITDDTLIVRYYLARDFSDVSEFENMVQYQQIDRITAKKNNGLVLVRYNSSEKIFNYSSRAIILN